MIPPAPIDWEWVDRTLDLAAKIYQDIDGEFTGRIPASAHMPAIDEMLHQIALIRWIFSHEWKDDPGPRPKKKTRTIPAPRKIPVKQRMDPGEWIEAVDTLSYADSIMTEIYNCIGDKLPDRIAARKVRGRPLFNILSRAGGYPAIFSLSLRLRLETTETIYHRGGAWDDMVGMSQLACVNPDPSVAQFYPSPQERSP